VNSLKSKIQNLELEVVGRVWKYGDGVNTDVIFPGKYTYTLKDRAEIAARALEDLDPRFAAEARAGDVIVAGRNWGNGSSREQAVTALKYKGIAAVVARSFARIYFRNGINQGLLLITCPEAVDAAETGDTIEIDLRRNLIHLKGREFPFPPLSSTALGIIADGGLVPHIRKKLGLASTGAVPLDGD
jgi:3-isopropylmalate/(R)-2-methylmalate dehydratase small subunit